MRLHLTDGTHRSMPVYGNMFGYAITGVTFDLKDVHNLRSLTDVQMFDFLNHLSTRFAPTTPIPSADFPDDYEV